MCNSTMLRGSNGEQHQRKSKWCSKVLRRVAFFVLTAALGKSYQ